jgi:hypothetical protein
MRKLQELSRSDHLQDLVDEMIIQRGIIKKGHVKVWTGVI